MWKLSKQSYTDAFKVEAVNLGPGPAAAGGGGWVSPDEFESAIRPAARIRYSRSERRIHSFPLVGGEHARKRRGLPQLRCTFSRICNEVSDLRPPLCLNPR
jgi:hypothetical protein